MCMKTPPIPKVADAPRRDTAAAAAATTRRKLTEQQGVYGNIFTSLLGDSEYGTNTRKLAQLGGGAAPAATA